MRFLRRVVLAINYVVWLVAPRWNTKFMCWWLRRWGAQVVGQPRYISARVWIDGTDMNLVELGDQCTISSNVRILTHDWAADTVARGLGWDGQTPLGRRLAVKIGDFAFIGTGSVILPGSRIGRGAIVGAGSVVRGEIGDYDIVVGSPARRVGDSREYVARALSEREAGAGASVTVQA